MRGGGLTPLGRPGSIQLIGLPQGFTQEEIHPKSGVYLHIMERGSKDFTSFPKTENIKYFERIPKRKIPKYSLIKTSIKIHVLGHRKAYQLAREVFSEKWIRKMIKWLYIRNDQQLRVKRKHGYDRETGRARKLFNLQGGTSSERAGIPEGLVKMRKSNNHFLKPVTVFDAMKAPDISLDAPAKACCKEMTDIIREN